MFSSSQEIEKLITLFPSNGKVPIAARLALAREIIRVRVLLLDLRYGLHVDSAWEKLEELSHRESECGYLTTAEQEARSLVLAELNAVGIDYVRCDRNSRTDYYGVLQVCRPCDIADHFPDLDTWQIACMQMMTLNCRLGAAFVEAEPEVDPNEEASITTHELPDQAG